MKNGNLAKNSDDQGTNFDLRAEVFVNGGSVTSGETFCITGITRNANQAKEAVLTFGAFTPLSLNSGDVISIKVSTRIGTNGSGSHCGGHSNAVGLRLYFDSASRASKFGILTATASTISPLALDPFNSSISLVSGPKPNAMRIVSDAPVFSEARVLGSPLVIDYTYDALRRLTNARYNDGRDFNYEYDPNGNTLSYRDPTTTTTYTYDVANELLTAQNGEAVWHYEYDGNGSLITVLPNGDETSGAKRYTYNVAGYLTKVESHNGSSWVDQAEMTYNGLGVRMTSGSLGVTTQYTSDGQLPLTITSTDHTATVLYGIGPVAEKTNEWNYVLSDGMGAPRQLTDGNGEVTMFVRYNPWGKPIETSGTGNFDASFIGTLIDATTGLIYVGNGQYYDPETGRFLTRGFNPNSTNPYVPWSPIGIMLGPLAVVSMYYSQKKNKKPNIYLLLLVLLFLALACKGCPEISWTSTPQPTETPTATATSSPEPAASATVTSTPEAPTQTATLPPPCCSSDEEYKQAILDKFGIVISDDTGTWPSDHIQIAYSALSKIDDALHGTLKSMLRTTKKFNHAWSAKYGGITHETPEEKTNFWATQSNGHFPHQLIYHETGHLLDNAQGDRYTNALDQTIVYTGYPNQTGERVMGRDCPDNQYAKDCKTPLYDRIDGQGYIQYYYINDPSGFKAETEMHSRGMGDGNNALEEWGDLFANYVAENFDSSDVGRAKYDWVHDQLFGG